MNGPEGDTRSTPSGHRVMLGREAEMARFDGILDAATAGRSTFVSLVGDPGIGKTLLANQVTERARDAGMLVSRGRCHEDATEYAFRPWLQLLRTLLEEPTAADLYDLVGVRIGREQKAEVEAQGDTSIALAARMQLFDSVARTLSDVSNASPVILLFEDVHWADSPSLLLLQFAAREITAMGIVVVVTHRPEQIYAEGAFAKAMRGWESEPLHERMELHGLAEPAVRELVEKEAASFASSRIAPGLIAEAGGNPLFIIQSVRHLLESAPGRGTTTVGTPTLPSDVVGVISNRLSGLGTTTRSALEAAACIGSVFDHSLLAATLTELEPGSEGTLIETLDRALASGLIEEGSGVASFGFSHALIRKSLVADLEPARTRAIHAAIVAALEATNAGRLDSCLEELAHHSYRAAMSGGAEKAAHYAAAIAHKAYFDFAFDESASWFDRAIETLRVYAPSDLRRRAELLLGLSQSLAMAGRGQEAVERYSETIEIARSLEHRQLFGYAVIGLGLQWGVNSVLAGGESRIEALLYEALETVPKEEVGLRALLRGRLAPELAAARPDLAAAEADRALAEVGDRADPRLITNLAMSARIAKWSPDNLEERLRLSGLALDAARQSKDEMSALSARTLRVLDQLEAGSIDEAKVGSQSIKAAADRILTPFYVWQSGVIESMWLLTQGSFQEAERVAQATMNRAFEHNPGDAAGIFAAFSFTLAWLRGDMAPLEPGMVAAIQHYPVVAGWRAGLALLYIETDRVDLAREQIDHLTKEGLDSIPRDASYLVTATLLAECAALLEDHALAERVYPMIEPFTDRLVVAGNGVACHGAVASFAGSLASNLDRAEDAQVLFEKGLLLESRAESRPLATRTRTAWARHMLRTGNVTERTGEMLARARSEAAALGMHTTLTRIDALLEQTAPATPSEPSPLAQATTVRARFERAGDYRTIEYGDREIRLKETKGLAYTEHLLRHPGRDFFAMELVGLVHGQDPDAVGKSPRTGDAGETLDAQAVAQYRKRIEDARVELAEAEELNDLGRIQVLREEIEFLADQLGSGLGIGGRKRKAVSDNERARINVTRAIRGSIRKIAADHNALGRRLIATIKTGSCCSYNPDPDNPVDWIF